MTELTQSRRTQHVELGIEGTSLPKTWFAADMRITPSNFVVGTLGFSEQAERRGFNQEEWSWINGVAQVTDTASEETVVPFAVDLHEKRRWVAFATTPRIQPAGFTKGFQGVLNQAVIDEGLIPTEWDVDLVTSRSQVDEWLFNNPLVHMMRRTVKFSNPGRDIDDDRQEMRALGARRKTEEFRAPRNGVLNTESNVFLDKLDGTETGDLELELLARGNQGVAEVRFRSKEEADQKQISDFERDLSQGMDTVLAALQEYVADKQTRLPPGQDTAG
ncbi:hypothetical protein ACIBF6_41315 [Streptosporangium amethystogenes]|uniref:hypothetical protein n=1 Tax=Streptosporangium amethystogenes TaxID=2002 RepID=UPI0037AFFDA3